MYRISEMNSKYIEIAMLEKKISDLITDVGNMKIQIAKTKEENPRLYTVREGENLESIALRFYNDRTGVNMLVKQNKLRDEFDIEAGRILEIPDR
jgi:nucleoid-associated protein YgaU